MSSRIFIDNLPYHCEAEDRGNDKVTQTRFDCPFSPFICRFLWKKRLLFSFFMV